MRASTKNNVEGTMRQVNTTSKEVVGRMTANRDLEIEGKAEKLAEFFGVRIPSANRFVLRCTGFSGQIKGIREQDRKNPEPQPSAANLTSNSGEGASTMGDKGGKKGKDKSQKQNDKKQKQKDKGKVDKQPKSRLLP